MMAAILDAFLSEELDALRQNHLFRNLRVLEGRQLPEACFDGHSDINLSSNNYLGLNTHRRLVDAAKEATEAFGVGSGAVRTIAGTMQIHLELEEAIARFKHVEASVVFQSGFTANAGTVSSILGKGDLIISDELNHASIIDGCRLSRAEIRVFPHKDLTRLEEILKETADFPGKKLLVTDGVFSMDGDIAPLPALVELGERYGAILMVDDAHSSGVLGKNGRGTVDHFKLHGRVDIQVGTLSKAIGSLGGYVCGSRKLIDFLYHRARPFLFSTSHPPAVAASCLAGFQVLQEEPEWIERLWENTRFFKAGLARLGFNTGQSETPITPIIVGKGDLAMRFSDALFAKGVFAQSIGFPTVPEARSRVRTIVTATHTQDQLQRALDVLGHVGRQLGII
jgi:glycine C-acetyltransferase